MRIGILTQPLYTNYGGLVQCYALQTVLQRMGHEAIVLQREIQRNYSLVGACVYYAKHLVKLLLGKKSQWHYYVSQEKRDYIAKNTNKFIEKHINPRSKYCYTTKELAAEVERLHLDAIIVGSDQVWRPFFSPCQPNYFLDFLGDNKNIKRISYAASFGGDEWTFSGRLTTVCGKLLKKFHAVSVREQSAIKLCKDHFGVDVQQVLDPTLLLEKDDYIAVCGQQSERRGTLFCYVLDRSNEKKSVIDHIAKSMNMKPFYSMPNLPDEADNLYRDIEKCVYPPVENWLSAFMEADMVLTDSFHGTVFSIIFNKPFWVVGNKDRGMARFESILSMFSLQNRLITYETIKNVDLTTPVDWQQVNSKRRQLQEISRQFIIDSLR